MNSMPFLSRRALLATSASTLFAMHHAAEAQPIAPGVPKPAIRQESIVVRGKLIPYRAETGETIMRNAAGTPRATIFSVAYLMQGPSSAMRPVTFLFNGGPGSSTRPLREGLGPKGAVAAPTAPGFAFADNPDSLIDATDLVFIDAPGTGYSRLLSEDAKPEYWGIEQDARAVAQFIEGWLRDHGRMAAPKFIVGESYAGTRAAQVARLLAGSTTPVRFRGVVLVSPALGTGSQNPMAGVLDRAALTLPSQAAVARWYGRGAHTTTPVEQVAAQARTFANGPYAAAMRNLDGMDATVKAALARQVSDFIGLPMDIVLQNDLFIPIVKFQDLLLADRNERVGLTDGREHTRVRAGAEPAVIELAPGAYDIDKAIDALFRDELGYQPAEPYVRMSHEANRTWDNKTTIMPAGGPEIFKAMTTADPGLHILLTVGCFDLDVPYSLPLTRFQNAALPPGQFDFRVNPTGHAVFSDAANRPRTTDDLRGFYRRAMA